MTLSLDLCQQLKKAGFPQKDISREYFDDGGVSYFAIPHVDEILAELTPEEKWDWSPSFHFSYEFKEEYWASGRVKGLQTIEAPTLLEYWAKTYLKLRGKK